MLLLLVTVLLVILGLRTKHRRLLAQTNAAGERRLSRYPGGHLSITDEDVARMPGTGAGMRESLNNRRTRASAYAPMASRETVETQFGPKTLPKALVPGGENQANASPTRPWPLPRRLTRSKPHSMIEVQPSVLSPVNEAKKEKDTPLKSSKKVARQEYRYTTRDNRHFEIQSPKSMAMPVPIPKPSPTLKPKPLFHEKSRSISHGMIPKLKGTRKPVGGLYVFDSQEPGTKPTPKAHMPRSVSLTSQEPGMAPNLPMPALPPAAVAIRRQKSMRRESSRQSIGGTAWSDSTILGEENPRILSQAESNIYSIKLLPHSPSGGQLNEPDPFKETPPTFDELNSRPRGSPGPIVRTRTLKAPLDTRKSFRASIRNSLPRSNSSGLSESLLQHGWSRSASNASMVREISNAQPRSKTPLARNVEPHISVFDFGLPSPSEPGDVANPLDLDDVRDKRKSTSILQIISGNERSPVSNPYNERPSSIATENPFTWDTSLLPKESAVKRVSKDGKGHKRQNCIRISVEPHFESPKPPVIAEQDEAPQVASPVQQSLRRPRIDPPPFRPPSRSTFDPQLTPTPHSRFTRKPNPSPYFQTLAKLTGYDSDSSPNSLIDTPTRKPSNRGPSGSHPNRQRPIFDGPSNIAQWPLASQHPTLSLGLRGSGDSPEKANIFRLDAQLNPPTPTKDDSCPPSLLYRFPSPPSPPRALNASRFPPPKAEVHGPRPAPESRYRSPKRRGSPIKSPGVSKRVSGSPGAQLRQSVIALRRMNSELSDVGKSGKEHKRYLSLGDRESAIFDSDVENRDKGTRVKGPRAMPGFLNESMMTTPTKEHGTFLGNGTFGTDGSWYDADGFLK